MKRIADLSDEYDRVLQERHDAGALKYGPLKFLQVNSIQEAMEEVADMANYCRYTWIKMAMLVDFMTGKADEVFGEDDPSFHATGEEWQKR